MCEHSIQSGLKWTVPSLSCISLTRLKILKRTLQCTATDQNQIENSQSRINNTNNSVCHWYAKQRLNLCSWMQAYYLFNWGIQADFNVSLFSCFASCIFSYMKQNLHNMLTSDSITFSWWDKTCSVAEYTLIHSTLSCCVLLLQLLCRMSQQQVSVLHTEPCASGCLQPHKRLCFWAKST